MALHWLAAALALAMVPHLEHLPWWLGAQFALALAWRWQAARVPAFALPGRWVLLLITLVTVGMVLYTYHTLFGRAAGVALLAAMVALKFLELRTLRDGMMLIFLGYFLVMANLLYTQSLPMAAYLLVILVVMLAAQVAVQRQHAAITPAALLQISVRMLLQSVPVMLILFVLFPRIPGPLWGLPKDAYSGLTGMSDEMQPGSISQLSQSDAVAFRVRFATAAPSVGQLYWRGPVLWRYDGRTWTRPEEVPRATFSYAATGAAVDYAVILEPHGKRWLFALDLPASVPAEAAVTDSLQLLRSKPVNEVLRYEMRSYPEYRTGMLSPAERFRALQLPNGGNPRARALAQEWQSRDPRPEVVVRAALKLFREQPFHYTLQPPLLGEEGIDEFLFATRRGFCEHYAGGFVFLMRAAAIPARVVTGYQGGETNALGGYLIVRQSDAHAWAEVWLEERGWVRVDPTAAVAPERVERGLYAAVADPTLLPFLVRRDNPWLRQFALGWDSLNNTWNEWVLAYGTDRQREFLSNLGFGPVDWRGMTMAMVVILGCMGLVMVGLYTLRRRPPVDPVARAYQRFCAKLARRGLARETHEGPLDFAARVADRYPELAARVRLITRLYTGLRYGRLERRDSLRELGRLVRKFKV